jgi:Zn-dependent M28 family amino/carboxypeptidase
MAAPITAEVYGKELHDLVDNRFSRFVGQDGNFATAAYLKKQFKELGLKVSEEQVLDSRIDEHANGKEVHTNVVGFLKGTDLAHEVVLLGAHYDSVNWEDTADKAPGVDDNGSGSALMLAVARALTKSKKFHPRRSVMFVAFNAEEEGLVGSDHFAKMFSTSFLDSGKPPGVKKYGDLKAVFIADEVAWPGSGKEQRQAIFETSGQTDELNSMVDTLAKMAMLKNATSSVAGDGLGDGRQSFVVNYHGFGSDHMSFLDAGIPAVLLIERDDDYHAQEWGHSARDTFEHVDMSYGASMTRLALRAVAAFAAPAS